MKKICFALLVFFALHTNAQDKYKCMVQMTNYNGEAAYMVVSLIDPQGNYKKNLYVFCDNGKYYV